MFNWLKKPVSEANVVSGLEVSSNPGGNLSHQSTISECEALKNLGNTHFNNGNLEDAAECYRRAIESNPRYAEAYINLGNVFYAQGNLDEAVALYRKAILFKPHLFSAHQNMGIVFMGLGQNDAAENCFREVIALAPEHPAAMQSLGVIAAERGDYSHAEVLLRRAIELQPNYAEAHNNLGNLLQLTNRVVEAEVTCRRALELNPNYAPAHFNLGNILKEIGQLEESAQSYRHALEAKPDFADAYCNLGIVLRELHQQVESEACYRHALQIQPNHAVAYNNLGNLLLLIRPDEAEACYRHALQIQPDYADVYGNLGNLLKNQHRLEEALICFQQHFKIVPEKIEIQHLIDSLGGNNTERAPVRYVEKYFDDYADKFETHLQQVLKYETPKNLVQLITQHMPATIEKWKVLDLGCGTGLVGKEMAPFTQQMVGVDLSTKMLAKADSRDIYHRLECMDLLEMTRGEKASSYDIIIAADVFIYIGKLDEIFGEIKRLLCPGGIFAFSIESPRVAIKSNAGAHQGVRQEYQLEVTGRYSHSCNYMTRLASANGFLSIEMATTHIRMENNKPVSGFLVLCKN